MKSLPDPSFRYATARHSDVRRIFARVERQRREERRTGQYSGALRGEVAVLFRERALAMIRSRSGRAEAEPTAQQADREAVADLLHE